MHHIPGRTRRLALVRALARRLAPGGVLAIAVWHFTGRERFERRRVPFRDLPRYGFSLVDEDDLEPGDALLRWGESHVRYCHQIAADEIAAWEDALPSVEPLARYRADGREGDLNEYLLLEAHRG